MPEYEYMVDGTDEIVLLYMSVEEHARRQRVDGSIKLDDGRKAKRVFTSVNTASTMARQWSRGHRSDALGFVLDDNPKVAAQEAAEHEAWLRSATGCSQIEVDRETGQVVTYSQKQKVAAARARGCVDLDGAYTA